MRAVLISYTKLKTNEVINLSVCRFKNFDFKENDLIHFAIKGDLDRMKAACEHLNISEVVGIRGFTEKEIKLFGGVKQNTKMWNPLLFAVAFKHLDLVKYLISERKVNAKLCLRDPAQSGEYSEVSPQYEVRSKCFAVLIALSNKDARMLSYLLNQLH